MSLDGYYSRGKVNRVIYNDRCGYAIIFYEPINDTNIKILPLRVADEENTIPLQIIGRLKPAGKPVSPNKPRELLRPKIPGDYESAQEFIHRKVIERKMDEVREACFNIRRCYEKTEKYHLKRREVISPRIKSKIRGKNSDEICDLLVDDVMQNVDYMYKKNFAEIDKTRQKNTFPDLKRETKYPKPVERKLVTAPNLEEVEEKDGKDSTEDQVENDEKTINKESLKLSNELSPSSLIRSERKSDEIHLEKLFQSTYASRVLQKYSALKTRRMDPMSQRAADALLFELKYGRILRHIKSEIRRLNEVYS